MSVHEFPKRGPTSQPPDGDLPSRLAKVESDVGHIQTYIKEIREDIREIKKEAREDFRILFGALIVTTLGLAALLAKGFGWFG